jgi:hypothetical protein
MALLLGVACGHPPVRPDARAYADALENGALAAAYAQTSERYRSQVSEAAFAQTHQDPALRAEQARRIRTAQAQLDAIAPELSPAFSPAAHPRIAAARAALAAFLDAAQARRFSAAYAWLSSALRARYTPSSLARDFSLAPDAGDRLRRAQAALEGPAREEAGAVLFPLAEGRAVVLEEEAGGFRVASLE